MAGGKPFEVGKNYNDAMRSWDVHLMVGGFETQAEADEAAKALAQIVSGDNGWYRKARTDG